MKLHDKKTEKNQKPTLSKKNSFYFLRISDVTKQICTEFSWRETHFVQEPHWTSSGVTTFPHRSLFLIRIPSLWYKSCFQYQQEKPTCVVAWITSGNDLCYYFPLLHFITNCSRSHAQFLLMWYVSQRPFSFVYFIINVIYLSDRSRIEPLLSLWMDRGWRCKLQYKGRGHW